MQYVTSMPLSFFTLQERKFLLLSHTMHITSPILALQLYFCRVSCLFVLKQLCVCRVYQESDNSHVVVHIRLHLRMHSLCTVSFQVVT